MEIIQILMFSVIKFIFFTCFFFFISIYLFVLFFQTNELEHSNFSLSSYYEESLEDTSFGSELSKPRSIDSDNELEASHLEMNSHQKLFPQQYCLRWKYHTNNMQVMFSQWLERESFCDVTLACEGRTIRAHKVSINFKYLLGFINVYLSFLLNESCN